MLDTAPFFPPEAELGIQTTEHRDHKLDLGEAPEIGDVESDEVLERFVRQTNNPESCMNPVGYGMLCNQWMLNWGIT